ncbi:MAG TPA: hypothetical protein PLA50_18590, partial [Bacteroidia bacterium]|nr:hypothetical protein [Bacteroidia bacterium]
MHDPPRQKGAARRRCPAALLPALAAFAVLPSACSPQMYRNRADQETYAALFQKTPEVENVEAGDVELTVPDAPDLSRLRAHDKGTGFLGEFADVESKAKVLSLDEALDMGIHHSREYLSTREGVFLTALDLTLARHRLAPIFGAGGSGTRATDSRNAAVQAGMTELVSTHTFA